METEILKNVLDSLDSLCVVYDLNSVFPITVNGTQLNNNENYVYLDNNAKTILDIGFGSGRDSLYFSNKYELYSIDPLKEFCEYGKRLGLKNVYCMKVQDMDYIDMFDGIWACASLLHVPSNELVEVLNKCYIALKENGVMYCSFKYGEYEGERNGRFFIDLNEESFRKYILKTKFKILEICNM